MNLGSANSAAFQGQQRHAALALATRRLCTLRDTRHTVAHRCRRHRRRHLRRCSGRRPGVAPKSSARRTLREEGGRIHLATYAAVNS